MLNNVLSLIAKARWVMFRRFWRASGSILRYNSLGDGYVKFAGQVSAGGIQGRIMYEGYTATAPFSGVITTPQGVLRIGVLDNTGGEFIIYEGTPRLPRPQTLGRFVCRWE